MYVSSGTRMCLLHAFIVSVLCLCRLRVESDERMSVDMLATSEPWSTIEMTRISAMKHASCSFATRRSPNPAVVMIEIVK